MMKSPANNRNALKDAENQKGFSLIEALVAFMIISIGMLGIASLQTISMRAGHTAITRTAVILSSQNILDRMRANTTQLTAYAVTATDMGTDNSCNDIEGYVGEASEGGSITAASTCTPALLAADDIFHWKKTLPPNVTASIAVTAPAAPRVLNTVTISINWTERDSGAAGVTAANVNTITVEM